MLASKAGDLAGVADLVAQQAASVEEASAAAVSAVEALTSTGLTARSITALAIQR